MDKPKKLPKQTQDSLAIEKDDLKIGLDALAKKLDQLKPKTNHKEGQFGFNAAPKGMAQGIRLSIEFISAIFLALLIGWYLDKVFETKPWLMVAFMPIGLVAGILNMIRTTKSAEFTTKQDEQDKTDV